MQRETFDGSVSSAESAARPRFALLAVVATMVLAVVTSGIALAGNLRGPDEDATKAEPVWLNSPAAIMAAPSAPPGRPIPTPNRAVASAVPDPGPQLALPEVRGPSAAANNERQPDKGQPSGLRDSVAQRTPEPHSNPGSAGPTPNAAPGKDEDPEFDFDPFVPMEEEGFPPAVTPTVTVSRGQDTADGYCAAPDCAVLFISMQGFEPDTAYTIMPYTDEWGNFYPDETLTTDVYGELTFERFLFDGVGQVVWVVVQTPDGLIESNHLRLEN